MGDRLRLEVVTPARRLLQVESDEVRLPASLGEIGVLPGHTPLLTTLAIGPVTHYDQGRATSIAVFGGFAEILPDRVTILADAAEEASEVDVAQAREDVRQAEEALKGASAEEIDEISATLRRAQTRLTVAGEPG